MEQKILVTGPRGLLGATLLEALPGAVACDADIRDAESILAGITAANPSWVVHTAALTNVGYCEQHPQEAHAVNAQGTKNVVEAARAAGARVLYISTASVFKGDAGDYREADIPEPINAYNTSKREGELHTLAYDKGLVLRLNLVGVHPKGSRGKNFFEWLVDSFNNNKDMTLFEDSLINPLSNWTIAGLIKKIVEQDVQEKILHIGSADVLSKAAIGGLVGTHFPGYSGTLTRGSIDAIGDGVFRPKQMWLNTDKAAALWGPLPTVAEEVETIFAKMA